MIDLKHEFITWYFNELTLEFPVFELMGKTFEDSPWHREKSVAVHTNMVVAHYISQIHKSLWDRDDVCRAIALAFHDTGKPTSRVERFSETRGKYYRFSGHELISARLWEDYATSNWTLLVTLFGLEPRHIYKIGWMIEYHKPWDIKKRDKLTKLALTINELTWADAFGELIMADTYGRVQDDRPASIDQATKWIASMTVLADDLALLPPANDNNKPEIIVLIGPSGAGKSTWAKNNAPEHAHYSWDALRHDWYDADDYANAFKLSCEDKSFNSKVQSEYIRLIKLGGNIVLDNTNVSNKRRNFFTTEARKRGYLVRAVLFPVSCFDVVNRQEFRGDKNVPDTAVINQYMRMQYPLYGDYDIIDVCGDNLP